MSANKFVARTTKPGAGNKYYIKKANGGYSDAIEGSPKDKDCNVLANCVGYAYGRFNEIGAWGSCKYLSPVNAKDFMKYKGSLATGTTPKLGACMVWQDSSYGHVAIVEKVISNTEVLTSESAWGSSAFYTKTRTKGSNGNWGYGGTFLGFIYNPAECCNETPKVENTTEIKVGDIVNFTGNTHYVNSTTTTGYACTQGKAKVTKIVSAKHPYHLIGEKGGSSVYGWVDAAYVKPISTTKTYKEGDTVEFIGKVHYVSANATSGTACKPGKAKITKIHELGKSKHPYHLVRIVGGGSTVYGWVDASDIK